MQHGRPDRANARKLPNGDPDSTVSPIQNISAKITSPQKFGEKVADRSGELLFHAKARRRKGLKTQEMVEIELHPWHKEI